MPTWDNDRESKRTLGIRDKKILYRNAKGRCENPACGKRIDFDEMQVGHKTSWSKRGRTNLANSKCLCWRCNNLQGTDSWATFLKKQKVEDPNVKVAQAELKVLGKPKGRTKSVVGLDKIETYLTKQGYSISSKKRGFDVVGVKDLSISEDRSVVVGLNNERTVTGEHVLKFNKKVSAFFKKMNSGTFLETHHVEGLIAYTGELSKEAPLIVKASKAKIKFRKL